MELRDLLKLLSKNALKIVLSALVFGLAGVLIYFIVPPKYTATGSFYIKRSVETDDDFFTYEGYYSQQAATVYTNTVLALFESLEIKQKALEEFSLPVNEKNLREISGQLKAKKTAPQLVTLTVKANSSSEVSRLWTSVANNTLSTAQNLNETGDPNLQISRISSAPVIKQTYWNLYVNFLTGAGLGFLLSVLGVSLGSYTGMKK